MGYDRIEYSIVFYFCFSRTRVELVNVSEKKTPIKIMRNMQTNKVLFLNKTVCHLPLKPIRNLYRGRPILGRVVLIRKLKRNYMFTKQHNMYFIYLFFRKTVYVIVAQMPNNDLKTR